MTKSIEILDAAKKWAITNELSLNQEKTVKLAFGLKKFNFDNPESTKLLGVHLSPPTLGFAEHAAVVGSKMNRKIFLLRRLATTITHDVLRTAYFALVHCHVRYCIMAWGCSSASDYLFKIQRRAVRVLSGIGYRDDCRNSFVNHNILTLPCEYILSCIVYANTHRHTFPINSDYKLQLTGTIKEKRKLYMADSQEM